MIKVKFLEDSEGSFNGYDITYYKKDEIAELDPEHETTKVFLDNGFAEVYNEKPNNPGKHYTKAK